MTTRAKRPSEPISIRVACEFLRSAGAVRTLLRMQKESPRPGRKLPVVPLAVGAVVVGAALVLLVRGVDYKALEARGLAFMRSLGPWTYFSGMALLPALAFPLTLFTLMAGELFSPLMTMGGVIAASFVAVSINVALTYWLARYALRPFIAALAGRYGYTVPKVSDSNALSIALAVRLTPGPPFFFQSYLLGMSEVPFKMYMVVSVLCQLPWMIGAIVLGKGIFNGNFRLVLYGVGVLVVAALAVKWLQKRYASRTA
jgi:uncharacterized membrane protein YdjX (TVP38/TMEM64 family)